ncbi:hypothetical protein [Dinghuibacter silviterrae]|uniref:Uncharacterized protein n=1 Tax=Dinghuibacter silviterrae TaxID=1539049 RepID=A0A4R8DHD7_9BACT|nr:hypothetical protein [Dinghuibacter silviterrae]TDW97129.1 hypothetical protein EDB95_4970 [Dinghuibacter silviterrae]
MKYKWSNGWFKKVNIKPNHYLTAAFREMRNDNRTRFTYTSEEIPSTKAEKELLSFGTAGDYYYIIEKAEVKGEEIMYLLQYQLQHSTKYFFPIEWFAYHREEEMQIEIDARVEFPNGILEKVIELMLLEASQYKVDCISGTWGYNDTYFLVLMNRLARYGFTASLGKRVVYFTINFNWAEVPVNEVPSLGRELKAPCNYLVQAQACSNKALANTYTFADPAAFICFHDECYHIRTFEVEGATTFQMRKSQETCCAIKAHLKDEILEIKEIEIQDAHSYALLSYLVERLLLYAVSRETVYIYGTLYPGNTVAKQVKKIFANYEFKCKITGSDLCIELVI